MSERPLFEKIVLGIFDRIDPNRDVTITNPRTGKRVTLSETELKSNFIANYKLQALSQPGSNPE